MPSGIQGIALIPLMFKMNAFNPLPEIENHEYRSNPEASLPQVINGMCRKAVSDAVSFGAWFGVEFEGPFVAGVLLNGRIVLTKVDPEVARLQEPHTGKPFQILVEEVTPMTRFAFRWHPFATP